MRIGVKNIFTNTEEFSFSQGLIGFFVEIF